MTAIWMILSKRRSRTLMSTAVIVGLSYVAVSYFGYSKMATEIFTTTQRRHQMVNDPITYRVLGPLLTIPQAIVMAPFGNGLGTEQVGGNFYSSGRMKLTTFEGEWPRIILEIGVIGFLGVAMTILGTVGTLWSARKMLSDPRIKAVFLVVTMICAAWGFGGVFFNHVTSFYFWIFVTAALAIGNEC
jgi:uncharacterized membrane protein YtjA (UPF0391 family)